MKLVELNEIFSVAYGNKFDLNKRAPCVELEKSIAFGGRSGNKNGVTAFVSPVPKIKPYPAGHITTALGGAILSSFVQPRPFYTAQNVAVLGPPDDMALAEKLYYCNCIEANLHRYGAFGREANRTLRTLLVPDRKSIPAWVKTATSTVAKDWETEVKRVIAGV